MRPIVHISGLALAVIAHTGETRAADDLRGLPVLGQERELFLEETTALRGSIGVRTWISRSELRQKLKSGAGATLADYDFTQSDSASAEVFFTLQDDDSGAFLKGAAALGVLTGGDFREVDYDSFTSQSIWDSSSDGGDGTISYANIDAGVHWGDFWGGRVKTTAFAGYQYVNENYVADGLRCNPVQQGTSKCSPYPDSRKAYDIDANWHLFRLGLGVDADIGNGFYFQGEAVAIPAGYYDAEATIIYQAPALGPAPNVVSDGTGAYGFQAEGILTYDVTENFTIGAGGRYWWFNSGEVPTTYAASTVFPLLKSSKTEVTSERYGLIAEAKYRF